MTEPPPDERWSHRTFRSLHVRNFGLFFIGQLVSVAGLFMDYTARAWLVLEFTGDGRAVGLTAGLVSLR